MTSTSTTRRRAYGIVTIIANTGHRSQVTGHIGADTLGGRQKDCPPSISAHIRRVKGSHQCYIAIGERERERESVCVCVRERETERETEREREKEREREREIAQSYSYTFIRSFTL